MDRGRDDYMEWAQLYWPGKRKEDIGEEIGHGYGTRKTVIQSETSYTKMTAPVFA